MTSYAKSYSRVGRWLRLPAALIIFLHHLYLHTALCATLTLQLVTLLVKGTWLWLSMAARLLLFTTLLAPGWFHLLSYFFFDPRVVRNLPYSNKSITSRNFLDIYLPTPISHSLSIDESSGKSMPSGREKVPVVIFVSGGAWIIGYKMWSALAARALSALGVVVVCPDYRNVPQGGISEMMDDVAAAINWTAKNIDSYGGDNNRLVLAGQSAGAHISMMLMLDVFDNLLCRYDHDAKETSTCRLSEEEIARVKLVVGVSGPYNLHNLQKHLHGRGLDTSILSWICNNDIDRNSPTLRLREIGPRFKKHGLGRNFRKENHKRTIPINFPPVALYHGSNDLTVPSVISEELAVELDKFDLHSYVNIYPDLSHTDLILEGPLLGENQLLRDIIDVIHRLTGSSSITATGGGNMLDIDQPLAPRWIVQCARKLNPF